MSLSVYIYNTRTHTYIYMLSIQVVWELFPLWTTVNSAAMSIHEQVFEDLFSILLDI